LYTIAAALAKSEYPTSAAGRPYRKKEVVPVAMEAGSEFVGIDEEDGQPVGALLGFVTHGWTQIPCRAHTFVHTQTPDHGGLRRFVVVLGGLRLEGDSRDKNKRFQRYSAKTAAITRRSLANRQGGFLG
jgi:hypothetical protein